jgi:hypothetical protein
MDRNNHYEVAFEGYLLSRGLCYIAVDETRRSRWGGESVKSLDFVVFGRGGTRFVVDVKGRRFPGGTPSRPRRVWQCWSEREDVDGIERWASIAGPDYQGLLVFTYHLGPDVVMSENTPDLWMFRGQRYLFRAVAIDQYRQHMYLLSPSWDTVTLSRASFRSLVRPLSDFTNAAELVAVDDDCPF